MPGLNDTTTKKEQELNEELELKNKRDKAYFENVEKRVANIDGIYKKYDINRYTKKAQMSQLIATWRDELKGDNEVLQDKTLVKLLEDMEAYAAMDVTATHSTTIGNSDNVRRVLSDVKKSVDVESKQATNIAKNVQKYIDELETKTAKTQSDKEAALFTRRQVMAMNIRLLMEEQINGYLPEVPEGAHHIKAKDKDIVTLKGDSFRNRHDMPLFPHDPSPSDIKQGYIGDCYMVAALANIARMDPDKIKEAIRDNGDGTVTVRLFRRTVPKDRDYFAADAKPPSLMEPFYVTVDKTVPDEKAARNCLWAAMIEKAVVASGLTRDKRFNGPYARPVPDNIEELYDLYKNMREDQRPSKIECPWLFDKDNNLVEWKADYAQIEGGQSEMFTESFMGEGYEAVILETGHTREDAAKDVIYDFIMSEVGKATYSGYEENARKILESRGDASQRLRNACSLLRGLKNGHVDKYYTPSFTEQGELHRLDKIPYDRDRSYFVFAETAERLLNSRLYEGSINYPKGNFTAVVVKDIEKSINENISNYNTKEQGTLNDLMNTFKREQNHILSGVSGRRYPVSYDQKFEEIKNEIEAGHIVAAGSLQAPEGDDKFEGGIFYSHAYNVIGTEEEVINGKSYKFLVMRNPHGSDKVPVYDYSTIPPKAMNGIVPEAQGVFKMELSHFMSNMDTININGKELSKSEKDNYDKIKLSYIKQNIMSEYDRVFTEVDKNLQKALKVDPDNKADIEQIRERIQSKLIGKEGCIIDGGEYRPFTVFATTILNKNNTFKPATKRIIEAAIEFADMRVNKITDPMASITKKMANNMDNLHSKEHFPDANKIVEKINQYQAKKREMLAIKDEFERQKNRGEEVKKKLSEVYGKERAVNLIHDYEEEVKKIKESDKTLDKCIELRKTTEINKETIDNKIKEYKNKLTKATDENEKVETAVAYLKECLKNLEEKQKKASEPGQAIENKKEEPQNELKKMEDDLAREKKMFQNMVNALAKTADVKEYIQLRMDVIENPDAWIDWDRIDELKRVISAIELERWDKRIEKIEKKQTAYFDKKAKIEELGDKQESLDDEQSIMIKEAFVFKKGQFNPLEGISVSEYVTEAKEYIKKAENQRFLRKKEIDDLKKSYDMAKKDLDNVEIKLDQIISKEKEIKNNNTKLIREHNAKEKDYTLLKNARDSYNVAYKEAFEKTEKLEALDLTEEIQKIAGEYLEKEKLHASNHTNSPEFDSMIRALKIVKFWPNIEIYSKDIPKEKRPANMEGALEHLKKQAGEYKKAKKKQRRLFETKLRKTRLTMADSIIDVSGKIKGKMATINEAERKELNAYFESKGRDNGERKAEKNKTEVKVTKDTKQINAPEVEAEDRTFTFNRI